MGIRTYIPTLLKLLRLFCLYATRYRSQLDSNMTTAQIEAKDVLLVACEAFLVLFPPDVPSA